MHSPWSTPGSNTPQIAIQVHGQAVGEVVKNVDFGKVTKLEPEKHDGPIEYKLHLLLRWRRTFTYCSTTMPAWANQHGRLESVSAASPAAIDAALSRSTYQPSTHNRQARLQQLTTQLLWRLQQSSPFHSSSNAKLVLPVLPEATPRLGVPDRPSKLLPGLEESQGALYEIGVADDGTLVGLADEEMEESLTNLRAMAASLGCVVDVHRRVIVGDCEWLEETSQDQPPISRTSKLWVAEVLVRPDNKSIEVVPNQATEALQALDAEGIVDSIQLGQSESAKQHLRVALIGASAAGKSSLLGTLTTSVLDNGRGKSRLSLLKHRHEIASGVTSSVAQELLGYRNSATSSSTVINYATGDVSSWPDIHNLADRLVFLSDSPGLPRYSKSAFRALISWSPAWTILCIAADDLMQENPTVSNATVPQMNDSHQGAPEANLSLAHLGLCLKIGQPLLVAITKMDLATKSGLRLVLGHILSAIKATGKTPVLFNAPSVQTFRKDDTDFSLKVDELVTLEHDHIMDKLSCFKTGDHSNCVPIIMTSAFSGSGIASLHALLRALPVTARPSNPVTGMVEGGNVMFRIDEVFAIPPSKVYSTSTQRAINDGGVVLCGLVDSGSISLGDELVLGPFLMECETSENLHIRALRRASSHHTKPHSQSLPRSLSETFSKSLQLQGRHQTEYENEKRDIYVRVRVVSLRNLRLPVSTMQVGDTGTVGIQVVDDDITTAVPLHKARKGMVLTNFREQLRGFSSFTASFPYSDFGYTGSPPLILGGHAIAYINSIRAAVKVTAVALEGEDAHQNGSAEKQTSPQDEVFSFDDDDDEDNDDHPPDCANAMRSGNLRISFNFVSTVEYLEMNDQVLVIPNVTPTGPITGPASTTSIPGFSGFLGRICERRA